MPLFHAHRFGHKFMIFLYFLTKLFLLESYHIELDNIPTHTPCSRKKCLLHETQRKLFKNNSKKHDFFTFFKKSCTILKMKKKMIFSETARNRLGHRVRCVRGHLHGLYSFLEVLHAAIHEIFKITRLNSTCHRFFEVPYKEVATTFSWHYKESKKFSMLLTHIKHS